MQEMNALLARRWNSCTHAHTHTPFTFAFSWTWTRDEVNVKIIVLWRHATVFFFVLFGSALLAVKVLSKRRNKLSYWYFIHVSIFLSRLLSYLLISRFACLLISPSHRRKASEKPDEVSHLQEIVLIFLCNCSIVCVWWKDWMGRRRHQQTVTCAS